ncbi:FIG000906: Predicted Permease [hydrothermal vent metagenome]|uniref:FIG000906: Predicted Permease n=1 Tax=hydrothermal vent metagenome TaxID=652676 RepID=A0A1W1CTE0_9ZZZZ
MKIANRYIIKTLFSHTLAVLVVLLGIYTFFSFLNEVSDLGKENYDIFAITQYILLTLPTRLYELTPVIILLGVILGLGSLAKSSEIIVLRSSGMSIYYFVQQVLKAGLVFVTIAMITGELLAPHLDYLADINKSKALNKEISSVGKHGFWLKNKNTFINAKYSLNDKLKVVSIFNIKDYKYISEITNTPEINFDEKKWTLKQPNQWTIQKKKTKFSIKKRQQQQLTLNMSINKNTLNVINKTPKNLSLWSLYKHISFLKENHIDASVHQVEFYKRLLMPLVLFVMLLLAIPFVFGSLRDDSLGKKIFLGVVISLVFQLFNQLSSQSALFYGYSPFLGSITPVFIIATFAFYLLQKIAKQ